MDSLKIGELFRLLRPKILGIVQELGLSHPLNSGAKVTKTSNTVWPTATYNTAFTFNSILRDDDGMVDLANYPTRITAKHAGWYYVYAMCQWAANTTSYRILAINRNAFYSNGQIETTTFPSAASSACGQNPSGLFWMDVGDYIQLRPVQYTGGNLDILYTANYSPVMGMIRIA
ncbi:MAG: hypothetical protein ACYC6L_02655 [Anaerolineae bacterium]